MRACPSCVAAACAAAVLAAASAAVRAQAPSVSPSAFPTGDPSIGRIVAEDEYGFAIRRYTPPVEFRPVARAAATSDSPEAATIAQLSAMAARDVDWFRSTWDAESLQVMDASNREQGHDAAFWTSTWERTFRDRRVVLTHRIDSGKYVVVVYQLVAQRAAPGAVDDIVELETPLKLQDGRWLATQELSSDPVLLYWKTPNVRPKRVVRGVSQ